MQKDDFVYVGHMLDMAQKAVNKVHSKTRLIYDTDEDLRLALTHLVQTIGEAAQRVSPDFQKAHPEIPWKELIGMRHKVVHDYMDVDYDIVWDVVTVELSSLVKKLEKFIPPSPS